MSIEEKKLLKLKQNDFSDEDSLDSDPLIKHRLQIYKDLLHQGVILVNRDIDDSLVEMLNIQLLFLSNNGEKNIRVLINSYGGDVIAALNAIDLMDSVMMIGPNHKDTGSLITTIGLGAVMSAAFITFMGGGIRLCYEKTSFLEHSIVACFDQYVSTYNLEKTGEWFTKMHERIAAYFALKTKKSKKWWIDIFKHPHDTYFDSKDALKYGIVHKIINPFADIVQSNKRIQAVLESKLKSNVLLPFVLAKPSRKSK